MPLQDANPTPSFGGFGLTVSERSRTIRRARPERVEVDTSPKDSCRSYYGPSRMDWIEKLRSGDSPFDSETLRDLRVRPVSPGGAPC